MKKTVSILLTLILVMGLFAGCGEPAAQRTTMNIYAEARKKSVDKVASAMNARFGT